jgi:hypothetical protein
MSNYRFIVVSSVAMLCQGLIAKKLWQVPVTFNFPLLDAVQDVVDTLFDERGRVVSSSCHAVPHGRSVD